MKKVLFTLSLLVALVIAAALGLTVLVPGDKVKAKLVAEVKAATGRDLAIDGKVAVSLFPSVSVQVANVALSNPPGFHSPDLLRLGALDVKLKLLPLLAGRIEIDSFVLIDPTITLETDRQGRIGWNFTPDAPPPPAGTAAAANTANFTDLQFGDVRIQNGRLVTVDDRTGAGEDISAVDCSVALASLDDPMAVMGSLAWRGHTAAFTVNVARPRALAAGNGTTALGVTITSDPVKLIFAGQADGTSHSAAGTIDAAVPSVRGLAAWASGKPLALPGSALGPLTVKGKLAATGSHVALTEATLSLDGIAATGDLSLDTTGVIPAVTGHLATGAMDLNPYLPPESATGPAAANQGWSDAALDGAGLRAADVDFTLDVQALTLRKIQLGNTAVTLAVHGGRLTADLTRMALYGGGGKSTVVLDGTQSGLGLTASATLSGLHAAPFLADAAGFNRLDGIAGIDVQISGRGHTQREIIASLAGKGSVTVTDGALAGVNLSALMRTVAAGDAVQKTDFAELSGTITINAGIISAQDLVLTSALLRASGAGTVDLPQRSVDYRLAPKAAVSLDRQGSSVDSTAVTVPVLLQGPWDTLSFRPDTAFHPDLASPTTSSAAQAGPVVTGTGGIPASLIPPKGAPLPLNPSALPGR